METHFENKSLNTVQQNYEAIWCFQRKTILAFLVCNLLFAVVLFWAWCQQGRLLHIIFAILSCVMFVKYLLKPRRNAKQAYNTKLAYYDGTMPPHTFRFYDDRFTVTDVDSFNEVPYNKIRGVTCLKSCIALVLADGRGFLMSRDGFQKGTEEECIAFLRKKCPQINPAKWQW